MAIPVPNLGSLHRQNNVFADVPSNRKPRRSCASVSRTGHFAWHGGILPAGVVEYQNASWPCQASTLLPSSQAWAWRSYLMSHLDPGSPHHDCLWPLGKQRPTMLLWATGSPTPARTKRYGCCGHLSVNETWAAVGLRMPHGRAEL